MEESKNILPEDKEDNNDIKEHKTAAYVYKHDDEIINKYIEKQLKRYYDLLKKNGMSSSNKPTNRKQRRKFMKKVTKEYNKQSFVKCRQKDLFK